MNEEWKEWIANDNVKKTNGGRIGRESRALPERNEKPINDCIGFSIRFNILSEHHTRKQLPDHNRKWINIRVTCVHSLNHFWRHIWKCPIDFWRTIHHEAWLILSVAFPKIHNLEGSRLWKKQIRTLEIAMQDLWLPAVETRQTPRCLGGVLQCAFPAEILGTFHDIQKRSTRTIFDNDNGDGILQHSIKEGNIRRPNSSIFVNNFKTRQI